MKRVIFLSLILLLVFSVFNINAKVSYEKGADGAWYAVVTNSSYKNLRQLNITGTFQKWEKPGIPMYKNADGIWEIKIKMDVAKIIYKFYNPDIEGDAAYLDDDENPEKTANPFGSFDYVLRRPKGDSGSSSDSASAGGRVKGVSDTIWYEKGADGAWYAIVINKSYKNIRQLNITGTFQKWEKPGIPMYKNADGNWEIKIKMDTPKIIYKFYNPDIEGDAAYLDDLDNPDKTANPFGSFDYVLRRPKESATATTESSEGEEEYNPRVGLWSRTYYWHTVKSDLTMQVNKAKDGSVSVEFKNTDEENKAAKKRLWRGENGSIDGETTRVWYSSAVLYTSATFKVHGKMLKNFVIDIEWNAQNKWSWEYDKYWDSDGASNVTKYYVDKFVDNYVGSGKPYSTRSEFEEVVSKYVGRFISNEVDGYYMGGNDPGDGTLGTDIYTYLNDNIKNIRIELRNQFLTETARDGVSKGFEIFFKTLPTTYSDQLACSFEYPDLDVRVGIWGLKYFKSRDPFRLVVGDVVGDKDVNSHNLEFYIHPTAVKGLNVDIGFASSTVKDNLWMLYANAHYDILGLKKFNVGIVQTMSSYSPEAVSMWNNAKYISSIYANIKPIDGLVIDFQWALQYHTRYMNSTDKDDKNSEEAILAKGYDFIANNALYLFASYAQSNFFKIEYKMAAVGKQFNANLSKNSPVTKAKDDDYNSGFMSQNEINYYKNGNAIGAIKNAISFNIQPIRSNPGLLTIGYDHEISVTDLYSPMMVTEASSDEIYQKKKETFTLYNVFSPSVATKFKAGSLDLAIKCGVDFSLIVKHGNDINQGKGEKGTGTDVYMTGVFFTFDRAYAKMEIGNISDFLKKINLEYSLKFVYFEPYWETDPNKFDAKYMNMIQWKKFINQLIVRLSMKYDIKLEAGYVFRYYHGDIPDKWIFYSSTPGAQQDAYNAVSEYFNWGLAFGFTYVIPYKAINEPVLFANITLGWDPFDIGDASPWMDSNRREDGAVNLDEQSSYIMCWY